MSTELQEEQKPANPIEEDYRDNLETLNKELQRRAAQNTGYVDSAINKLSAAAYASYYYSLKHPLDALSWTGDTALSAVKFLTSDNIPLNTGPDGKIYLTSPEDRMRAHYERTTDASQSAVHLAKFAYQALLANTSDTSMQQRLKENAQILGKKSLKRFAKEDKTNPINLFNDEIKRTLSNPLPDYELSEATDSSKVGLKKAQKALVDQQTQNETELNQLISTFNTTMEALSQPKASGSGSAPFRFKELQKLRLEIEEKTKLTLKEQLANSSEVFETASSVLFNNGFSDDKKADDKQTLKNTYSDKTDEQIDQLYTNAKNLFDGLKDAGPLKKTDKNATTITGENAGSTEPLASVTGSDAPTMMPAASDALTVEGSNNTVAPAPSHPSASIDIPAQLKALQTSEAERISENITKKNEVLNNKLSDMARQQHLDVTRAITASTLLSKLKLDDLKNAENEIDAMVRSSNAAAGELGIGAKEDLSELDTVKALAKVINTAPKGLNALAWQIEFTPSNPDELTSLKGSYNLKFNDQTSFNRQEGINQQAALIGLTSDTITFTARATRTIDGVQQVDRDALAEMLIMQMLAILGQSTLDPSKAKFKILTGFKADGSEHFEDMTMSQLIAFVDAEQKDPQKLKAHIQPEGFTGDEPCTTKDIGGNVNFRLSDYITNPKIPNTGGTWHSRKVFSQLKTALEKRRAHDKTVLGITDPSEIFKPASSNPAKDTHNDVIKEAKKAAVPSVVGGKTPQSSPSIRGSGAGG